MKVPVEALVWSLASGRGDLSGLSTDEIQPETRSQRACQFIHHVSWQHHPLATSLLRIFSLLKLTIDSPFDSLMPKNGH